MRFYRFHSKIKTLTVKSSIYSYAISIMEMGTEVFELSDVIYCFKKGTISHVQKVTHKCYILHNIHSKTSIITRKSGMLIA